MNSFIAQCCSHIATLLEELQAGKALMKFHRTQACLTFRNEREAILEGIVRVAWGKLRRGATEQERSTFRLYLCCIFYLGHVALNINK